MFVSAGIDIQIGVLPEEIANIINKVKFSYKKPYSSNFLPLTTKLLLRKRHNTILMTKYSMIEFLNKNNLSDSIKLSGCVPRQKLYLAFSPDPKKQKKVKKLIKIFEKEITRLKKENYFQKLLKKYKID